MPYCPECGREIQRGVKFCPECGAQLGAPGATKTGSPVKAEPQVPGAGRIRTLAGLEMLLGVVLLVLGALALIPQEFPVPASVYVLTVVIFFGGGAFVLLSEYGVLRRKPWSRMAGTVAGLVLVVVGFLLAFSPSLLLAAIGVLAFVLGVTSLAMPRLGWGRDYFAS